MPKTERKILDRLIQYRYWLFLLAATALAWLARKGGMDHSSPDMNVFLVPWYEQIAENGGFRALAQGVGDYNVLYQTLICLFSYIPLGGMSPMYLYKAVSIFFDFLLALVCGYVAAREKGEALPGKTFCTAYAVVLMIPTVILNSSVWGQCDSMYTSVCILALYLLYRQRYPASFALLGIAFGLIHPAGVPLFLRLPEKLLPGIFSADSGCLLGHRYPRLPGRPSPDGSLRHLRLPNHRVPGYDQQCPVHLVLLLPTV